MTSRRVARKAGKVLSTRTAGRSCKSLAGSALRQAFTQVAESVLAPWVEPLDEARTCGVGRFLWLLSGLASLGSHRPTPNGVQVGRVVAT